MAPPTPGARGGRSQRAVSEAQSLTPAARIEALGVEPLDQQELNEILVEVRQLSPLELPPVRQRLVQRLKPVGFKAREIDQLLQDRKWLAEEPSTDPEFERGDEVELGGQLLADFKGDGPDLVFDEGDLHRYCPESGLWEVLPAETQTVHVASFAGRPVISGASDGIVETKPLKIDQRHAKSAMFFAKSLATRVGFFQDQQSGVAFQNGFLTVKPDGYELKSHSPDHRSRYAAPCDWDSDAEPDNLFAYFEGVFRGDEDSIEKALLIQQFLGACLIGKATRFGRAMVLLGAAARNGKSQLLEVARSLFPPKSIAVVTPQDMAVPHNRAELAGKWLGANLFWTLWSS